LQKKGNPPNLIFGKENAQGGKAIKQSRQNPLNRSHRAVSSDGPETPHLVHQIVIKFFHQLVRFLRILEKRAGALTCAIEINVNAHRHIQIQRCRPELIVFLRRISFTAGKSLKQNGFETDCGTVLHLRDGVRHSGGQRQDADPNQPVRINRTVLLGQPTVVGVHHSLVSSIVLNAAPELGSPLLRREQDFGIDSVLILLFDPLLGSSGSRSTFISAAKGNVFVPTLTAV
jgi:hypothetical protein